MPSSSLVVSATVHVAVIGLAVLLTAGSSDSKQLPPKRTPILVYSRTIESPEPGRGSGSGASVGRRFAPLWPTVPPPGLPPIDVAIPGTAGPLNGIDTVWEIGGSRGDGGPSPAGGVFSAEAVEVAAAPIPGGPTPRYPEVLRSAGIEGRVTLEFVVDTTGRVDQRSIRVLDSNADAFVTSIRDALAGTRYHPALVAGHPVPQLVRQEFAFALTH
jgi:periplasmic protein TonB